MITAASAFLGGILGVLVGNLFKGASSSPIPYFKNILTDRDMPPVERAGISAPSLKTRPVPAHTAAETDVEAQKEEVGTGGPNPSSSSNPSNES